MFKYYLKATFRNIIKHKGYSVINITGLAVGIACCLLILLFVRDELSFENFHSNADRICRTIIDEHVDGKWEHNAGSPDLLGPALQKENPEILSCVRLFNPNWIDKWTVSLEDKYFYEERLFFADASIFEVFTFPLLQGNPETALKEPNTVVITNEMARKYFGNENPLGKALTIDDTVEAIITGVAETVPENTHFRFDFLVSFESMPYKWAMNTWRTQQFYTYVLLDRAIQQNELDEKLSAFMQKHSGKQTNFRLRLQPIKDIHLHSKNYSYDMAINNSDIAYVYIFSTIAVFILIIACINFMSLSTARSFHRAKEVGLRKVVGAQRSQLMRQFLGESFVLVILAALAALIIILCILPAFNQLAGKNISLKGENILYMGWILAGVICVTGILSGSYPSFFLSAFQPMSVLKGHFSVRLKSVIFRRVLVVLQFAISLFLITGTFIIYNQIHYCLNRNPGFNKERVVVLPLRSRSAKIGYESFRNSLLQNSNIKGVAGSDSIPGRAIGMRGMFPEGNQWYPRLSLFVDFDFIPTLGIEIKEGRNFSRDFPTDVDDAYIVNASAVKNFGWDQALGKSIFWAGDQNKKGFVIGVVKDFNFKSFRQGIEPLVLHMTRGAPSYASIRIGGNDIQETMSYIQSQWQELQPGHPFDYFFLDDDFDKLYRSEERMGIIFRSFTILALFVSCLGLFGLTAYTLEKRTKEIGIRKVLGASVIKIVLMFSKNFMREILLANLISWPVVYWAMSRWLLNFAFRIEISIWSFILSSLLVISISLMTIGFQSLRAASANPIDSLRYE
jgi:putative ABC transport system permease protein